MTQGNYQFGGWSQRLNRTPLPAFTHMAYGMVTNLSGLTTGTAAAPGWSPAGSCAPRLGGFTGPVLWSYGGGLCSPRECPVDDTAIQQIIQATERGAWDGVDFDDECSMNIEHVTQAMQQLKQRNKHTQYGFIAGYSYNRPLTTAGAALNQKVRSVIASGHCDFLVHYCYASRMWTDSEIEQFVGKSLERSLDHGAHAKQLILALTSRGLTDHNLELFLDQVIRLQLGGLYVWAYENLSATHTRRIVERLGL